MSERRPGDIAAAEGTGDEGVPASTASSNDFADGERRPKTRRGKMTLRIPDDEVARPSSPASSFIPPTDRSLEAPQAPKTLVDASAESSAMGLIERHSSSPPTVNTPGYAADPSDIPRGFSQPPIQAGRIIGIGTPSQNAESTQKVPTLHEEEVQRLASEGKLKAAPAPRADDSWTPYQPMVADRLDLKPGAEPSYLGPAKRDPKQTLLSPFEVAPVDVAEASGVPSTIDSEEVDVPISTDEPEIEAAPPSDVGLEDLVTLEVAAAPVSVPAMLLAPVASDSRPPVRPPSVPAGQEPPPMRPRAPSVVGLESGPAVTGTPGPPPMRPKAPSVSSESSPPLRPRMASIPPTEAPRARMASIPPTEAPRARMASIPPTDAPRPRLASVPPTDAPRARMPSVPSEALPPQRPKLPSVTGEATGVPPQRPKMPSVTSEPTGLPPQRPKMPSVQGDVPPVRPKSHTPPPPLDMTAVAVELPESAPRVPSVPPSREVVVESPPPSQAAPLTGDPVTKKRVRGWWEDFFNEDYLKTQIKGTRGAGSATWIRREVDFIEDSLGVEKGAMVLDLGCGEGSHAIGLAERGYRVIGIDASPFMVGRAQKEAQRRNVAVNFVQADMRDISYEEAFDGVFSWDMSFGYFDDEKNAQLISLVHRALRKGGQFLLDVQNRDYLVRQSPSVAWFEGDGCICMDEMQVDWISSRMRMKRTMIATDGRSRETEYSIRIYSLHELGRLLHDHGFRVAEVSGRIETPGVFFGPESPRTVILAEKR